MKRAVALHGGGEFLAGDEPFLESLLAMAWARMGSARPIRVAVVPTAAARGRPGLAADHGVAAFERVAKAGGGAGPERGGTVTVERVAVLDPSSAADPDLTARLAAADVIHFPGGDPDLIPTVLAGSPAWDAVQAAWGAGAVVAGASAGAMALAPWTWTPDGGLVGLGVVRGLYVVPHADRDRWTAALERFGADAPAALGALGLAERTGAITDDVGTDPIVWRVVGPGEVRWQAVRGGSTIVVRSGETLETPHPPS